MTTINLPTGLTFSDIREVPEASLNALNGYLTSVGAPNVSVGSNNPLILKLNDLSMGGAPFIRGSEIAICGPINNIEFIPLNYILLIVAVGGDILDMPIFFEIVPTDICPFSDNNETWETWGIFGDSHKPVQLGPKWYRSSAVGQSGELLKASEWAFKIDPAKVITIKDYRKLINEFSNNP